MRLSRSATDPLAPGPAGFAHRGLHRGRQIPENSLAAFAAALAAGAGIECDLRLTADDQILMFHDADGTRLCGDPVEIGRSTLSQLRHLRIAGEPVPILADLLALVDGRVPLLLEVKVADDLARWAAPLRRALEAYRGPFGVMSFEPRLVRLLGTACPGWRRGLVVADRLPGWRRTIALTFARPDFLAVETDAAPRPWVARWRRALPVYSWTVRTAQQRAALSDRVDALIWEDDGRP